MVFDDTNIACKAHSRNQLGLLVAKEGASNITTYFHWMGYVPKNVEFLEFHCMLEYDNIT